jgi:hypothetical protein
MSAVLNELSPDVPATGPGWDDVLARAETLAAATSPNGPVRGPLDLRRRDRWTVRRRLVLAGAVIGAVLIPFVAFAAVNGWWFFDFRDTPRPLSKPTVVTTGSWQGHPWELVAYTSAAGTCWSITFTDTPPPGGAGEAGTPGPGAVSGADNALSCGGVVGLRPPQPRAIDLPTVMYMTGSSFNTDYPSWIAGPVVVSAKTVVIRWRSGLVVQAPTSKAVELGKVGWYGPVRFFAAPLPKGFRPGFQPSAIVQSLTGLDGHGNVVACLVPVSAHGSFSPLSDCRR